MDILNVRPPSAVFIQFPRNFSSLMSLPGSNRDDCIFSFYKICDLMNIGRPEMSSFCILGGMLKIQNSMAPILSSNHICDTKFGLLHSSSGRGQILGVDSNNEMKGEGLF